MSAYIYISPHTDPALNAAIEEYLYLQRRDLGRIYMLWVNEPSVFMGRYQSREAEVDMDYMRERGIRLMRRISGGGTVYHDAGNLNYTVIDSAEVGQAFDLKRYPEPIVHLCQSHGLPLVISPRGDLRLTDGRKVGGSAQAARSGRMLYHLSLLISADLTALDRVLASPEELRHLSRVQSVRSVVANLCDHLPECVGSVPSFVPALRAQIQHYLQQEGIAESLQTLELDTQELMPTLRALMHHECAVQE